MQQGKTAGKDFGWTDKVADSKRSYTVTLKVAKDRDAWNIMIAYAKEQGT